MNDIGIRIICGDKHIETLALVNSGFESGQPDLAVSIDVAKKLGLWPPKEFKLETFSTAGGEASVYRIEDPSCHVELIDDEEILSRSRCDILIDPYLDEVLISDYLSDELGIIVLSFRRGLWRHYKDPSDKIRGL